MKTSDGWLGLEGAGIDAKRVTSEDLEQLTKLVATWEVLRIVTRRKKAIAGLMEFIANSKPVPGNVTPEFDDSVKRGIIEGKRLFNDLMRTAGILERRYRRSSIEGYHGLSTFVKPGMESSRANVATRHQQGGCRYRNGAVVTKGTPLGDKDKSRVPLVVFQDYLLLDLISEGSVGKVFEAIHRSSGTTYAIKVVPKGFQVGGGQLSNLPTLASPMGVHRVTMMGMMKGIEQTKGHPLDLHAKCNGMNDPLGWPNSIAGGPQNESLLERLIEEAQTSLKMNHPNVVKTHAVVESQYSIMFIMEYCEYGDLISFIRRYSPLEERVAKRVFGMIFEGIWYMHSLGLCHRDLKPENILVARRAGECGEQWQVGKPSVPPNSRDSVLSHYSRSDVASEDGVYGSPEFRSSSFNPSTIAPYAAIHSASLRSHSYILKIADFGTTALESTSGHWDLVGTMSYAAPEVLSCSIHAPYSGKVADVWSLGVMLYAIVFGQLPWNAEMESIEEAKRAIVKARIGFAKGTSRELRDLLTRMLTVDPKKRITLEEVSRHPWMMNE